MALTKQPPEDHSGTTRWPDEYALRVRSRRCCTGASVAVDLSGARAFEVAARPNFNEP
jgi:hypothetical protein